MRFWTFLKICSILLAIIVVGFFCYKVGVLIGEENILTTPPVYLTSPEAEKPPEVDFAVFWQAWRRVEEKFLDKDKINYQKMVYGAVNGMIETLDDPYTTFFNPVEAESFEEELKGKSDGVGMYVGIKDEQLTIISPLKGSPAEEAGLKPEDKILKIADTPTIDLSIEEAVKLIKGPRGSTVLLLINRDAWKEPQEVVVKRTLIQIPTLDLEFLENKVALVKIYQFNQLLLSEFQRASVKILDSSTDRIILDLRNNPGGYLEVAQALAGWFLDKGKVVVWQDKGENEEKEIYYSKGPATFANWPIVVLTNQGSASASEILAGALRDQRDIKLVGAKSFGKGSVQEQLSLIDGSSLKVTVARWLTPNNLNIDEDGLEPDFEVENIPDSSEDSQLEKAVEIIKSLK